ncbi:hypothetical protein BH09SUM1_BH09SUM1_09960 [soil metagenome]
MEKTPDKQRSKIDRISKWWGLEHDALIEPLIRRWEWEWHTGIIDAAIGISDPKIIALWKRHDPRCKKHAWYNVLTLYAIDRAKRRGITKNIRKPLKKDCVLCGARFNERNLPFSLVRRIGMDQLDFCVKCFSAGVWDDGDKVASAERICEYLRKLASIIQRVPSQGFGEGMDDLLELPRDEKAALLLLLRDKPATTRVKEVFGSWLQALIAANVLENGTRKMTRGIQCISRDGHICFSLGEKTIDDLLYFHGVPHDREPRYPEGNYRGDFKIAEVFVEYFGLAGNPDYDLRTTEKIRLCEKHGIQLIAIFPEDIVSRTKLEKKLSTFIGRDLNAGASLETGSTNSAEKECPAHTIVLGDADQPDR